MANKELRRKCVMCGKSPATDSISLFRFPKPAKNNNLRCTLWAKYVFPDGEEYASTEFQEKLHNQHRMLCQNHFGDNAFTDASKKQLKRSTFPHDTGEVSIMLPSYFEMPKAVLSLTSPVGSQLKLRDISNQQPEQPRNPSRQAGPTLDESPVSPAGVSDSMITSETNKWPHNIGNANGRPIGGKLHEKSTSEQKILLCEESQPEDCVDPLCEEPEELKPDIDELNTHIDHLHSENMAKVSSVEDLEKCCHLCLSQDCTLTPLVGSGLEEMLMDLFSLEVREGSLPALACDDCAARVSSAHGLQRLVRASHNHIMQLLQVNMDSKVEDEGKQCIEGAKNKQSEIQGPSYKPENVKDQDVPMQVDEGQDTLQESDKLSDDEYSLPDLPFEFHLSRERRENVCNFCQETFKTFDLLTKHRLEVHGAEEAYVCRFCGKFTTNRKYILKHERTHLKPKKVLSNGSGYKCEICGAKFGIRGHFERHLTRIHSGQRLPACGDCSLAFDTRESYFDHFKEEHDDKTPFRCSQCPRAFKERDMLDRHMKGHYTCKIKTTKAPVESTDTETTETSVAAAQIVSPVSQDIEADSQNDESVSQNNAPLKLASPTATDRKLYPCVECKNSFVSSYAFNRHKLRCRTMECEVCKSKFEELKSLLHHYKSEHGITAVENSGVTRETPASHAPAVRRAAGSNMLIQIRPEQVPRHLLRRVIKVQQLTKPKRVIRVLGPARVALPSVAARGAAAGTATVTAQATPRLEPILTASTSTEE